MDDAGRDFTARRRDFGPWFAVAQAVINDSETGPGLQTDIIPNVRARGVRSRGRSIPWRALSSDARACASCVELGLRLAANLRRKPGILQDLLENHDCLRRLLEAFENQRLAQEHARDRRAIAFPIRPTSSEPLRNPPHESFDPRQRAAVAPFRISAGGTGGCGVCWAGVGAGFLQSRLRLRGPGDLLAHKRNIVPGHRKQLDDREGPKQADRNDKRRAYRLPGNRSMCCGF